MVARRSGDSDDPDALDWSERDGFHVVGGSRAAKLAEWSERKDAEAFRLLCRRLRQRKWLRGLPPDKLDRHKRKAAARVKRWAASLAGAALLRHVDRRRTANRKRRAAKAAKLHAARRAEASSRSCLECGAPARVGKRGYVGDYCSTACYQRRRSRERYRRAMAAGTTSRSRCTLCREVGHNRRRCPSKETP